MLTLNAVTLLLNGLTLALALGFLIIILWHDSRKEQNRFFVVFLIMVILWMVGSLLLQASLLISDNSSLVSLAAIIMEMGFVGSSVAIYILTTVIIGVHSKRFRWLALGALFVVIGYRLFLIVSGVQPFLGGTTEEILSYQFQPSFLLSYLVFDGMALAVLWHYRRKMRSRGMAFGIFIFVLGQGLIFVNPVLLVASFSTSVSAIGVLVISFAILQQEIIKPLSERISQVEAMHKVSLAISSQLSIDTVLDEITKQAAGWLNADGVGLFLKSGQSLQLAKAYDLPSDFLEVEIPVGYGVAGSVAKSHKTIYLESYQRDWLGEDEFAFSRETFGSLICVPLFYGDSIIGVLMVVASQHGRLFDRQDVYLLELLGAQAAVAIAHSRLFTEQHQLTSQLETAHSQLETVLTSTKNPVIAVDRKLRLIFANPAATDYFKMRQAHSIAEVLPGDVFPRDLKGMLREIRQKNSYIYEIALEGKIYLCHLAKLGQNRIDGWVAVLNDITQLKELDRFKSEMVRMASHDLKNPLMGAMAYLDLLGDDLQDVKTPDVQEYIDTIGWQLERMHRIIRGILDIERLKDTLITFEVCYPTVVVENAIYELTHFIADRGISLTVEIEDDMPVFLGDREKFERVLINLIENAVKFTLKDGKVEVKVYSEAANIIFKIKDNGIGIPEELQMRVFDRFFRGQQKGVEHVTGSGLGLSLVKTVVESHKGKIWLMSVEGQGTEFYVSVPITTVLTTNENSYSH